MTVEPIELKSHAPATGSAHSSGCACGHEDESDVVLDVRTIPHAIRHATIFGALGAIAPGFSIVLVADHNPLPLLAQLRERQPDAWEVSYLQEGPDVFKLQLERQR